MSKKLIGICILCLSVFWVHAQLSWQELLPVGDYQNLRVSTLNIGLADGSRILTLSHYVEGEYQSQLQRYSMGGTAMWAEPIVIEYGVSVILRLTSLNEIVLITSSPLDQRSNYWMSKYDLNGQPINSPGIEVLSTRSHISAVIPDHEGGIHILAYNEYNYLYQYVDHFGNLLYPITGMDISALIPGVHSDTTIRQTNLMNDGRLLVRYMTHYRDHLISIDSQLNLSFHIETDEPTWHFYGGYAMRSDGGFYMLWPGQNSPGIQSYNAEGQELWAERYPVNPSGSYYQLILNEQDQLFVSWEQDSQIRAFKLNPDGTTIWQEFTMYDSNDDASIDNYYYPDATNGYYVLRAKYHYGTYTRSLSLMYLNSDGTLRPWEQCLVQEDYYADDPAHIDMVDDGVFKSYYYVHNDKASIFAYNEIDADGTSYYPEPGLVVESSSYGIVNDLQALPLGDNYALAFWRSRIPDRPGKFALQYNVVDPDQGFVFEEPIDLTSTRENSHSLRGFPTEDGGAMVVWKTESRYYTQKISNLGIIQWAEPKLIMEPGQYDVTYFSYYNHSLYAVQESANHSSIRLFRFVDGQPVGDPNGTQVATWNPEYLGTQVEVKYFHNGFLIWGQSRTWDWDEMYFVKKLGPEGEALKPWGESGIRTNVVIDDFVGMTYVDANILNNSVWVDYSMAHVESNGGHSSEEWYVAYDPYLQFVNNQGDLLFGNGGFELWGEFADSMIDETGYYRAYNSHSNHVFTIKKLLNNGYVDWTIEPLSDLYWQAYYWGFKPILKQTTMGNIICLGQTKSGNMHHLTYFIFNQDGELSIPDDRVIYSDQNYDKRFSIVPTRMGTYLLVNSGDGYYAGIQFIASGSEPITDPEPTYSFGLAKARPNPFGEELYLELEMDRSGYARMEIFNIRGQRVYLHEYQELEKGKNILSWNGKDNNNSNCANGIYFIRLSDTTSTQTIKAIRVR